MSKIRTSIRQDMLYLLKDIFKDASSELKEIDFSRDTQEVLQEFTLTIVKSCNKVLDKIEGRGYN